MKAREWVARLQTTPDSEQPVEDRFFDFLKAFGEETAALVAERTKFSKPESKFSACEGAVREQRSKFQSICNSCPALSAGVFDTILDKVLPEWKKMLETQKKHQQKKEEDNSQRDNSGRSFASKR